MVFIFDIVVFIVFMIMIRLFGSNCLEFEVWVEEFNIMFRSFLVVILFFLNCLSCLKKIFYLYEVGKKKYVIFNSFFLILVLVFFLKVKIKNF